MRRFLPCLTVVLLSVLVWGSIVGAWPVVASSCRPRPTVSARCHRAFGYCGLPATDLYLEVARATDAARSVRISGPFEVAGEQFSLDLRLGVSASSGTITTAKGTVNLIRIRSLFYLQPTRSFWVAEGGSAAATKYAGKWIEAPADSPDVAPITPIVGLHILALFFPDTPAATDPANVVWSQQDWDTANGQTVVPLSATYSKGNESILDVQAIGKPYIVHLGGVDEGVVANIDFSGYNAPVHVSTPRSVIPIHRIVSQGIPFSLV